MGAQHTAVQEYVKRNGWLLAEYVEVESGKRSDNRPELLRALAHCKKAKATLVIAKLDRLARNVAFIANLMENRDIEFVCCDMPQANRLTIHIMAVMAEHEREMIAARTKAALAAAAAEIQRNGFRISKRSGNRITKMGSPKPENGMRAMLQARHVPPPDPTILAVIEGQRIAGYSYQRIADDMTARGIKAPHGGKWYASTVRGYWQRKSIDDIRAESA